MGESTARLNKPIYLGQTILDLSQTLMYKFHYEYIKPMYGERTGSLFTDTDSLCYVIKTNDFYKDISNDVHKMFDTSEYDENHPCGIPAGLNKKVIGLMKDEVNGKQILGFVGLRSKLYAIRIQDPSPEDKRKERKCKGVKKSVVKNCMILEHYKDCLFNNTNYVAKFNTLRSRINHRVYNKGCTIS